MTDRLERLERHLSEVLAGPRRLMRSLGKHTTGTDAMTNPNHPVHPINVDYAEGWTATDQAPPPPVVGLTKREHFAAMAMQGYCAVEAGWNQPPEEVARCSAVMADALIAELNKETS